MNQNFTDQRNKETETLFKDSGNPPPHPLTNPELLHSGIYGAKILATATLLVQHRHAPLPHKGRDLVAEFKALLDHFTKDLRVDLANQERFPTHAPG